MWGDMPSLATAKAYTESILHSLTEREVFRFLGLEPTQYWSSLLFLDEKNYCGVRHLSPSQLGEQLVRQALDDAAEARICFTGIPKALWGDATKRTLRRDRRTRIRANIMVTRRGTLRRVALYSGRYDMLPSASSIHFESNRIPSKNSIVDWISAANGDDRNLYFKPLIFPEWRNTLDCELVVNFQWDSEDQVDPMSLEDACLMLEHWCKL